ncbi:MAG: DUF445 domain-containing protein [Planctomycetes bacterium]|nr:DUF445 domain-containing protein [Planctomycetota bacterium]NUQ35220.1 DUF445 family protein [Planctomycetaceae bacterium]
MEGIFDPTRVKKGNRRLIATTLILTAIMLVGLVFRDGQGDGTDFGSVLYVMGLSGLVGFSTNWLAIRMLFRPRKSILGLQGVIPRQRRKIASRVSKLMEERLISGHRLHAWLRESGAIDRAADSLTANLPALLSGEKLTALLRPAMTRVLQTAAPDIGAKLRTEAIAAVQEKAGFLAGMAMPLVEPMLREFEGKLAAELTSEQSVERLLAKTLPVVELEVKYALENPGAKDQVRSMIAGSIESLLGNMRVAELLESEILKQNDEEIEQMIDDAAADQLVFLQVAGGALGMLAGLAMIWPWLLAIYFLPAVIMWARVIARNKSAGGTPSA